MAAPGLRRLTFTTHITSSVGWIGAVLVFLRQNRRDRMCWSQVSRALSRGALSMAAGEDVSVSSQADTEKADLTRERHELATEPQAEEDELTGIYVGRGLEPDLARTVARRLRPTQTTGYVAGGLEA